MALIHTASQTVGPFFKPSLGREGWNAVAGEKTRGERITMEGRVLDGDGVAVPDVMIEIWQANTDGRYDHPEDTHEARLDPNFHGFGRSATDADGRFSFATIKPGPLPGRGDAMQAPHINLAIFARGLLRHLFTRVYFEGEPLNAKDPVLNLVPANRRATLIARASNAGDSTRTFRFDIRLQGDGETVFFDI